MTGATPPLPAPLPLRTNFGWTIAGNVGFAASQWGVLVVVEKLLGPEAVGRYALALAIAAPVMLFSGLNLRAVQATDARGDHAFGAYAALRIVTTAAALLLLAAVAPATGAATAGIVLLVAAAKAAESLSDIGYGLFQRRERLDRMARSLLARGPLGLAALAAAVVATKSLAWGVAALAAAWALVLAVHDVPRAAALAGGPRRARPVWSGPELRRLAVLAAPLGVVLGLVSLTANVPRYAVDRYLGEAELGVFAGISYLIVAGITLVNAMGQAAAPRLANQYAAGDLMAFRLLLARLIGIALVIGAAGFGLAALVGRPLLTALYSTEYARLDVLLWVVGTAAALFVATFLGYGITAARYFRSQLPLFAATTVTVAAASVVLVPDHGLVGAAQALLAAALVQIGGSAAILAHALRRPGHAPR